MPDCLTCFERVVGLIKELVSLEKITISKMQDLAQNYQTFIPGDIQRKIKLKWVLRTLKWFIYAIKSPCGKPMRLVELSEWVALLVLQKDYNHIEDYLKLQRKLNRAKRFIRVALRHLAELFRSFLAVQGISKPVSLRHLSHQQLVSLMLDVGSSLFNEARLLEISYKEDKKLPPKVKRMFVLRRRREKSYPLWVWYFRWRIKLPRRRVFWLNSLSRKQFFQRTTASENKRMFLGYENELMSFALKAKDYNRRMYKAYSILCRMLNRLIAVLKANYPMVLGVKFRVPWGKKGHG